MPSDPDQSFEASRRADSHGRALPADALRALLEQVRIVVEGAGWDAPFTVYGVRRLTHPGPTRPRTLAVAVEFLHEGGHPFEDLPGLHLPDRFDGAILACEGWEHHVQPDPLPGEPVRRETRMLTYLDRAGNSACMLLRYSDRRMQPEEVFVERGPAGRVQDVFRRFIGLPVDVGDAKVVHALGRIWLASAALLTSTAPDLPIDDVLRSTDPLEVFVSPLRENLVAALTDASLSIPAHLRDEMDDPVRREAVLRSYGLYLLGGFRWEDLRSAPEGFLGSLMDPEVLEWCDAGMFAVLLMDGLPPQHDTLDRMVLRGSPAMAEAALTELTARSWDE